MCVCVLFANKVMVFSVVNKMHFARTAYMRAYKKDTCVKCLKAIDNILGDH